MSDDGKGFKVGGQVARCRSREKLTTNSKSGNWIRYNCLPNPVLTGNPTFVHFRGQQFWPYPDAISSQF